MGVQQPLCLNLFLVIMARGCMCTNHCGKRVSLYLRVKPTRDFLIWRCFYIGGIIRHARALNAFTNPSTNSYKRLVPGYEAPVLLAYSARNRSASCRIPHSTSSNGKRVEIRFPDPMANPYLSFAAMLMAGLDGIENKIHPGEAMDKNLYDLPEDELSAIPTVAHSLRAALEALDKNRDFLLRGDVFSNDLIDAFIALKMAEVKRVEMMPHPAEFDMYYSG